MSDSANTQAATQPNVVYHKCKYVKKDGTTAEYLKAYIPKPRLNDNIKLERQINALVKQLKIDKQTQRLKDILSFIEDDLNISPN